MTEELINNPFSPEVLQELLKNKVVNKQIMQFLAKESKTKEFKNSIVFKKQRDKAKAARKARKLNRK